MAISPLSIFCTASYRQSAFGIHTMKSLALLLLSLATAVSAFVVRPSPLQQTAVTTAIHQARKAAAADKSSDSKSSKNTPNPAKQAALEGVLNQIERSYGRGSIVKLGDAENMVVDSISSGSLTLDAALGGGYPKGRVVEIYGPESSGKTTLALHAIAEAQKAGGIGAFIDAEHALDPAYAASLGVDVDELFVTQPDSGEMALDVVDKLVRSAAVDVIVVDSVAALVPRAELEGDMSDMQIGLQARLMSKAMRKITGSLALSQCTVIFLNQLRSKVGVIYGSPETTSGGNALKFYASVRLDTRRKEILPDNIGIRVKVKVVKNKVSAPFKVVNMDILFGSGIDTMGCMLDAAVDLNIVERKGSWYAYKDQNLAQGRLNAVELLKKDADLAKQLEVEIRLAFSEMAAPTAAKVDETPLDDADDAVLPVAEDSLEDIESFME
jgi:recombination protein RecA